MFIGTGGKRADAVLLGNACCGTACVGFDRCGVPCLVLGENLIEVWGAGLWARGAPACGPKRISMGVNNLRAKVGGRRPSFVQRGSEKAEGMDFPQSKLRIVSSEGRLKGAGEELMA